MTDIPIEKNDSEGPVPDAWRPLLSAVVAQMAEGQAPALPGVTFEAPDTWQAMRAYIEEYGETLTALPDAAWETSVCIWYGTYWQVLVDLFTEEEGRSDLVLDVRVREADAGYVFELYLVYVP